MRKRNDEVMVDMAPGPVPMAPQGQPRIWLEFDDGSAVRVRGAGLIGRDPAPATGDRFEHLITLADDTLSVSRTHLEFGTGESGLWIRDLSSTNGSAIEMNGHRAAVPPGLRVPAPAGSTIHIGAHHVTVRSIPACEFMNVAAIQWGAASHAGAVHERRHERNQDAYCAGPPVFVVADGMGGHCAGDVASREVVAALLRLVGRVPVTGAMLTVCLSDARARIDRIAVDGGRPQDLLSAA
jgi:FHA domain